MSEVLRVTRLAVPNLSISAEEKVCTRSKTTPRSLAAKSVEMAEATRTDARLIRQEQTVMATMITARTRIAEGEPTATPPLIIWASSEGSIICPMAESRIRTVSPAICFRLSRTLEKIVFIGFCNTSCSFFD